MQDLNKKLNRIAKEDVKKQRKNSNAERDFKNTLELIKEMENILLNNNGVQTFQDMKSSQNNIKSKDLLESFNKVNNITEYSEENYKLVKKVYVVFYMMCFSPSERMVSLSEEKNKAFDKLHLLEFYRELTVLFPDDTHYIATLDKEAALEFIKKMNKIISLIDIEHVNEDIKEILKYTDILETISVNNSLVEIYYAMRYAISIKANLTNAINYAIEEKDDRYNVLKYAYLLEK